MKHSLFCYIAAICSAMTLHSCNNEISEEVKASGKQKMTFSASYDNNVSSRTTLGADLCVLWAEGDALRIFDGTDSQNSFSITSGNGTSTAQFIGEAAVADTYYALYPYGEVASQEGNVIKNVYIPTTQYATPGSFDPRANIMTAVSTSSNNLAFKNVCSYAKITTKTAFKNISFVSNTSISGWCDLEIGDDGVAISTNASSEDYDGHLAVNLVPSNGVDIPAGTYYIAIRPVEMSSLSVKCISSDVIYERSINMPITAFTRGTIIDLGEVGTETGWSTYNLCPDGEHPHQIDLGVESGLKWSCMNVGASNPSQRGGKFAWGEIETKSTYNWATYKYCNGTQTSLTKYCNNSNYGTVDDLVVLQKEDDAATQNWHGTWRMPTQPEIQELIDQCDWSFTTVGYTQGYLVKSKAAGNTNTIFLPASGTSDNVQVGLTQMAFYWSSSLRVSGAYGARALGASYSARAMQSNMRYLGMHIRPVSE